MNEFHIIFFNHYRHDFIYRDVKEVWVGSEEDVVELLTQKNNIIIETDRKLVKNQLSVQNDPLDEEKEKLLEDIRQLELKEGGRNKMHTHYTSECVDLEHVSFNGKKWKII